MAACRCLVLGIAWHVKPRTFLRISMMCCGAADIQVALEAEILPDPPQPPELTLTLRRPCLYHGVVTLFRAGSSHVTGHVSNVKSSTSAPSHAPPWQTSCSKSPSIATVAFILILSHAHCPSYLLVLSLYSSPLVVDARNVPYARGLGTGIPRY